MKIIHSSGQEYKLNPDTKLEMSRLNPFFNEYGEQSLPITLPADEQNRRLTGYPDDPANASKYIKRIDAVIQAGVFSVKARQAILSAKKKEGIKTTFYLNEGSFFERFKDLQLSEIFKDKKISFASVPAAVSFVRNLMVAYDERFACFTVRVDHNRKEGSAYINAINRFKKEDGYYGLLNEDPQTEKIEEKTVAIPVGLFISPFIRARHLLKEIFAHAGYELVDDNLLLTMEPFKSMVFLNNNVDTIADGKISYVQIVPDCMASSILNVYRNRFCCEFIPDEITHTVRIVLFDDVLGEAAEKDLTSITCSDPDITYPETFRQLKLVAGKNDSASKTSPENSKNIRGATTIKHSTDTFDTLKGLLDKYPDAEFDKINGHIYRIGFKAEKKVKEILGSINSGYYAGGTLNTEKKESPDVYIDMDYNSGDSRNPGAIYPYIKKSRMLNSTVVYENTETESEETKKDSESEDNLAIMLCFVHHNPLRGYDIGTIYNYDCEGKKLWDYTLSYNGQDGLFEKFWRNYDDLLRNSMLDVSVEQILSETDKLSLSSYKKVVINNQEFFPNEIKYIPGIKGPTACSYFTTKLYEPLSTAMQEADRLKPSAYYWISNFSLSNTSKSRFILKNPVNLVYYVPPTTAQFAIGGRFHSKTYPATLYSRGSADGPLDPIDGTVTIWLEAKRY